MIPYRFRKLLAFGPCVCMSHCQCVTCLSRAAAIEKNIKPHPLKTTPAYRFANIYLLQRLISCLCMISKSELLIHFIGYPPTSRSGSAL
jgi:hypothetical protein